MNQTCSSFEAVERQSLGAKKKILILFWGFLITDQIISIVI